jgi:hypothetical protein
MAPLEVPAPGSPARWLAEVNGVGSHEPDLLRMNVVEATYS